MQRNSIERQIKNTLKEYPGLSFVKKTGVFSGTIIVDDDDDYHIEIEIGLFPKAFPVVRETGERIARNIDNHIYSDGQCCFTTSVKEQLLLRKGVIETLPQFVSKIVIPFFQNNSYREINDSYNNGEYSHGTEGVLESYMDILGISDKWLTITTLVYFLKYPHIKKGDNCYCGRNQSLEKCHINYYKDLNYIPRFVIEKDLKTFGKLLK